MAKKVKDKLKRRLKRDGKTPMSPKVDQYQDANGKFKKGNPGKPEGAVSPKTRFVNLVASVWGEKEAEVFRKFFKKPDINFLMAMDRITEVMNIDKSGTGSALGLPPFQVFLEGENGDQSVAPQKEPE